MVLPQLLSIRGRAVGVTNLGVMLLFPKYDNLQKQLTIQTNETKLMNIHVSESVFNSFSQHG